MCIRDRPYIAQVAVGKLDHVNVFGNDYNTPDGTGVRDYIHVMDLASGHVAAIHKLESRPGPVSYTHLLDRPQWEWPRR